MIKIILSSIILSLKVFLLAMHVLLIANVLHPVVVF